ncbi:MAG: tetratricopeptide repeat protein [Planctomycetota bacterium]|nr:tetratricopeptide repeat protein [Planctomycetota bacterium]
MTPTVAATSTLSTASPDLQDPQGPGGRRPQGRAPGKKPTREQELLLRSARNAVALEQIDEAADLFESYLVLVPTDHEVRTEYAGLLVQKGRLEEARDLYLNTIEALPNSNKTRHMLVNVLIMSGEYTAATTQLEEIVRRDADDLAAAAMLCRAYSWVKDLERAKIVFDRYLRNLDPTQQRDQQLLAPALLDMQKPREALPYLLKLQAQAPEELEWSTSLVYCYELIGDEAKAARAVDAIASLQPNVTDARIHLVDQLLSLSNYQLAQTVNEQILQADPENVMARLMGARILLESYDVRRAREVLNNLEDELGGMRRYSLAMAQLYHLEGQWVAAQSVYEAMLMDRPTDDDVRIKLALLYRDKGDLHRALAELKKVPAKSPYGPLSQLEQATTMILEGRPDQAAGLCAALADQRPNDVAPVLGLVRAHLAMDHIEEAQAMCQRFIDGHPSDKMALAQVRVVLGKAQLLAGNSVQAARTFQLALREPSMHEPEAFYGLAKARTRGDSAVGSELARLSSNIATSGEGIRMRIELGKLALAEQDFTRATYYLKKALRWQPNNVAAKVLLGEAYSQALKAGNKAEPIKVLSSVLETDPSNTRARLALARAYAIQRDFDSALKTYTKVLEQDATYDYAAREYARTLYWNQQYEASLQQYEKLIARLPTEGMAVDFFDDPNDSNALQSLSDFESGSNFAESVKLELIAKRNMSWRPPLAQNALQALTIREPANQEALFDLAQIRHRRGQTSAAIGNYQDLIRVAGGHQEAKKALAGAQRDIQPSLHFAVNTEERAGRDGLAFMDESSHIADTTFPLGDKNDTLGFGIGRRTFDPGDGNFSAGNTPLNANVLRLFGSSSLGENTVVDMLTEFQTYSEEGRMSDRLYFDGGVTYTSDEQTRVKLRLFSQPVVENGETLSQDIYRQGGRVGVEIPVTRRFDLGASGMFADYSDDNNRVEGNAFVAYEFMTAPKELRVLVKMDFIDCAQENVFGGGAQPNLAGLDNPYFSPKAYSVYSVLGSWRHQLGKDWFTGADNMFYTVTAGLAFDSNGVGFTEFSMGGGYDITNWLSFGAGLRLVRSSAIDITSGFAEMTIRWP